MLNWVYLRFKNMYADVCVLHAGVLLPSKFGFLCCKIWSFYLPTFFCCDICSILFLDDPNILVVLCLTSYKEKLLLTFSS